MGDNGSSMFSVRIVSIDYYMTPPVADFDISYSPFHGGKVNEVPVIRVYGSTPSGQKTCLHIHRVLPYLYIPCSDLGLLRINEVDSFGRSLSIALEKALKLKTSVGSQRQHVHGCEPVRARKFYGYHTSEELFLKIYLYYPQDVSGAANLLLSGAVWDKSLQPYESHIPFLLQFLIDYNLYGMGHLHVSKLKFRYPIPDVLSQRRANKIAELGIIQKASNRPDLAGGDLCSGKPIWTSSSILDGWIWEDWRQPDSSRNEDIALFRRQNTTELEGDAVVDDIVNQQFISYSPLDQAHSGVKMVQSLIPIWEEEIERNGAFDVPPEPGRPFPRDVLRIISDEILYEDLLGIRDDTDIWSKLTSESLRSPLVNEDFPDYELANIEKNGILSPKFLKASDRSGTFLSQGSPSLIADPAEFIDVRTADEQRESGSGGPSCSKDAEADALRLLNWLVSSQAMEDINSDDELITERGFSPKDIEMVNRSNTEFERDSQKECQDILDSIDFQKFEELDAPAELNNSNELSLNKLIPQVDGSCDDAPFDPVEPKPHSEIFPWPESDTSVILEHRQKRPRWGSLPISSHKVIERAGKFDISSVSGETNEKRAASGTPCSVSDAENDKGEVGPLKQNCTVVECSLRDLMRRKRLYRLRNSEHSAPEEKGNEHAVSEDDSQKEGLDPYSESKNDSEDKGPKSPTSKSLFRKFNSLERVVHNSGVEQCTNLIQDDHSPCVGSCTLNCAPGSKSKNDGKHSDCGAFDSVLNCNSLCWNSYQSSRSQIKLMQVQADDSRVLDSQTTAVMRADASNVTLKNTYLDAEKGLVAMTFFRKPPVIDQAYETESEFQVLHQDYPPFFTSAAEDEGQVKHLGATSSRDNEDVKQDCAVGVPVTHRSDGSYLFMLGSALAPPSKESVDNWLSSNGFITSKLIAKRPSTAVVDTDISSQNDPDSPSPEFPLSEEKSDCIKDPGSSQEKCSSDTKSSDGIYIRTSAGSLLDASQISGPDEKSRPTPLSQIGFRDPASEGQGQQLTLLSIEVQAETRGNLRPDPRFDAINVIVLVCQEDDETKHDVIVLLRCDSPSPDKDLDAISEAKVLVFTEELELLDYFTKVISALDPDILMGWDVQRGSLGFLAERAAHFGIDLLSNISRSPSLSFLELGAVTANSAPSQNTIIDDEWGRTHASGVRVCGRIILNVWRLMRHEVKLNIYTAEAVANAVLRRKVPFIPCIVLTKWFASGPGQARYRAIGYTLERGKLNLQIMNQLDMINRTSELARVFGIDFFSVLSRGSQYRVESMFLRLAHTQNYLAVSPGNQQVANQPAMECLPLVMEPESRFYADPVIVLDFQSLYPSMVIAYNLCFCTCLGKIETPSKTNVLGVSSYLPDPKVISSMKHELLITPNGVAYVPKKVLEGILPRLLEEILSTRIMVKQAMKKTAQSHRVRQRILNARQLALKLIANVTYGYTAAGFSGRMPCAELADSIVQCGRRTLERAISFVNSNEKWKARVVYGDTDSMFVLVEGRSRQEAFRIGEEIAAAVTEMNPNPVKLKMEKVYHPCVLLTKKRYVGYSFEHPYQSKPMFDAKGIETIRRDTCGAVSKTMEQSLKLYFESQDIDKVKAYLCRQWTRILSDKVSLEDFIFAKEVRLGTYSGQAHSLPPAAIVAMKSMLNDPRAEPRYAERVPYVVVHGKPGSRLADMVVDPHELLDKNSVLRLNDLYYITKQIIPALQRAFGLVGADLNRWFLGMPRPVRESVGKRHHNPGSSSVRRMTRIDYYYMSKHCILCGELVHGSANLCCGCSDREPSLCIALTGRTCKLEKEMQHLNAICRHCGGGDWCIESGVRCESLACSVFFQRRKVQKQLHSASQLATAYGLYPSCDVELF